MRTKRARVGVRMCRVAFRHVYINDKHVCVHEMHTRVHTQAYTNTTNTTSAIKPRNAVGGLYTR